MKSLNVLVVDDNVDAAEALADVLDLVGHTVEVAFTGEEAIELFCENDFDVAFMDVMMPGMNGVDSLFEIRKIKPDAKVFMMTGYSIHQLLTRAIDHGALGIVQKPFDMQKVLENMEEIKPGGIMLVEDDDPEFGRNAESALTAHDYRVHLAFDGEDAVDHVAASDVDVLILDLNRPVIDGLDVFTQLKKRDCEVPTIIVARPGADFGDDGATDALRDMAMTGLVTKPYEPETVLDALQRLSV